MFELTEIKKNGKTYVHNPVNHGYYGVRVSPGSENDNTMEGIGIHWEYLQYAKPSPLVAELRSLIHEFRQLEEPKETEATVERPIKSVNEPCPKCHTYCYGDCEAY